MSLSSRQLGVEGEAIAANFLKERGYQIIERNFRCNIGEIDLVVKKDEFIIFAEIKTRTRFAVSPLLSMTRKKQSKIRKLGAYYLVRNNVQHLQPRFDVIAIIHNNNQFEIEHVQNAF